MATVRGPEVANAPRDQPGENQALRQAQGCGQHSNTSSVDGNSLLQILASFDTRNVEANLVFDEPTVSATSSGPDDRGEIIFIIFSRAMRAGTHITPHHDVPPQTAPC